MQGTSIILLSSILIQGTLFSKALFETVKQRSVSNILICIITVVLLLHFLNLYFYQLGLYHIPFHIVPVAIVSYGPLVYAHVYALSNNATSLPKVVKISFIPVLVIGVMHAIGHDSYYSWIHISFHAFIYLYSLSYLIAAVYLAYDKLSKGDHRWSWLYHFILLIGCLIVFIALDYIRFITSWEARGSFSSASIVWVAFIIAVASLLRTWLYPSAFLKKNKKEIVTGLSETRELELIQRLEQFMAEAKPHLKHDLSIRELGEKIDIPHHTLSKLINRHSQKSFIEFINEYRVETAKHLLCQSDIKILAVALESGFSNKTSFNRTFKKFVGLAPSDFRDTCSSSS